MRWFEHFDANRDGFLSRTEAEPLLLSTRMVAGRYEVGPIVTTRVSFDGLDADRNGFLSRAEAATVLSSPYDFERFDVNRDGFLSRAEAEVMLRSSVGVTYGGAGGSIVGPR